MSCRFTKNVLHTTNSTANSCTNLKTHYTTQAGIYATADDLFASHLMHDFCWMSVLLVCNAILWSLARAVTRYL